MYSAQSKSIVLVHHLQFEGMKGKVHRERPFANYRSICEILVSKLPFLVIDFIKVVKSKIQEN